MKEIQAIIQPFKLSEVADALQALPGVGGITALDVRGFGHQRGAMGIERPGRGSVNFLPKVLLLLVVDDAVVDSALAVLRRHAHTGNPGDGKVFILPVDDVLRVRTGELGPRAL